MIAKGFKSVIWVASVGAAALSCYMVSLRVATERADLAKVEGRILAAKREIRSLQTELGTRGRMTQLEQWNSEVLALSAPTSAQFVPNAVSLARFEQRQPTVAEQSAEIRMASAETGAAAPVAQDKPAAELKPRVVQAIATPAPPPPPALVHQASYTTGAALQAKAAAPAKAAPAKALAPKPQIAKAAPVKADKPLLAATISPKPKPKAVVAKADAPAKPVKATVASSAPAKAAPAKAAPKKTASTESKPSAARVGAHIAKGLGSGGN
jgi:hypothetical protein